MNCTIQPNVVKFKSILDILDLNPSENLYLNEKACKGILNKADKRNVNMNVDLKKSHD